MSDEIEVRWLENVEYGEGLALQNQLVDDCLEGRDGEKLLLIEHQPVYTIGRTRDLSSLRSPEALPHPLFETNRGGQATWHGPGQLVAYPILRLENRGRDLHRYVRFLEEVIIQTCNRQGVPDTTRREGLTGVWKEDRKLASIGVGVRKWISMHGLALNVTRQSLTAFDHITPCGIANVTMTSLESEAKGSQNVKVTGFALADIFMDLLPRLSE